MFESGSGLMDIGRGFYVEQMPKESSMSEDHFDE